MNEQVMLQHDQHQPLKTEQPEKAGPSMRSLSQPLCQVLLF